MLSVIIKALNEEATLSHPWSLTTHGFVSCYGFKAHCTSLIHGISQPMVLTHGIAKGTL